MNDQTPRRLRGSLVERAAEMYHFGQADMPPLFPEPATPPSPPVPVQRPAPEQVRYVMPDPAPEPEPVRYVAPEPIPEAPRPVAAEPMQSAEPEPLHDDTPPAAHGQAHAYEFEPAEPAPLPISEPRPQGRGTIDRKRLADGGMLVPGAPVGVLAEEFRLVKRQLILTSRAVERQDHGRPSVRSRMILVCSAKPDEGKTFCAINLALSMAAERDVEILLVDADFAKPDILDRLGLPQGPGLLDALSGTVGNVEDCIIPTDVPQLSVLPAGTKSNADTELIASDRARRILDGLAAADPRRIVIFDSPPVLAASPASVLALHVGQVMLVVRADQTTESELRESVGLLDACEHIQLVLNSVSFQPGGRRFGSYYGESGK